ncbi:hypothetical protein AB3N59_14330 [Leptospira sp. WS92.C1]
MEQIKIENYIKDNPNKSFPYWSELDSEACGKIRNTIIRKLQLISDISDIDLMKTIEKRGAFKGFIDIDNIENTKKVLLTSLPTTDNELIYINWYRINKIDQMYLQDLIDNFDDIWYPSVDDIDVINTTISWIFSISHFGGIKIIQLD